MSKAPYNFVRLPDKLLLLAEDPPKHDLYDPNKHTGYIDVTLTTETPMFIRASSQSEHFFNYGKKPNPSLPPLPVIPGSSLRGMIANLVSILGHARLRGVSDQKMLFRAITDKEKPYSALFVGPPNISSTGNNKGSPINYPKAKFHRGGYLVERGDQWYIRPAKQIHNETYALVRIPKEFQQCKFVSKDCLVDPPKERTKHQTTNGKRFLMVPLAECEADKQDANHGKQRAKLVIAGTMKNARWYPAIYEADDGADLIPIPQEMRRWYQEDNERQTQRDENYRKLNKSGDPLFYLVNEEGQLVFFGPSLMFRIPYQYTPHDLLQRQYQNQSATGLDLVQSIFGFVDLPSPTGREIGIQMGKVQFTDLTLAKTQDAQQVFANEGKAIDPPILASPKVTATTHYLVQKGTHWSAQEARLRGYKLYWHRKNLAESKAGNSTEMIGAKMIPVNPKLQFMGRVYFQNLNDIELGVLLTALQLPPSKRHKMGMSKPYGYGSVRLECTLHLSDRDVRYKSLDHNGTKSSSDTQQIAARAKMELVSQVAVLYGHDLSKDIAVSDLWQCEWVPRVYEDLSCLLEWDFAPEDSETEYLSLGQWKNREKLPVPAEVLKPERRPKSTDSKQHTQPAVQKDWLAGFEPYPIAVTLKLTHDNGVDVFGAKQNDRRQRKLGLLVLRTGQKPADILLEQPVEAWVKKIPYKEGLWRFKLEN